MKKINDGPFQPVDDKGCQKTRLECVKIWLEMEKQGLSIPPADDEESHLCCQLSSEASSGKMIVFSSLAKSLLKFPPKGKFLS